MNKVFTSHRFLAILCALALLMSATSVVIGVAAEGANVTISDIAVDPETPVTIPVTISGNPGIASLKVFVDFDESLFDFSAVLGESYTMGEAFPNKDGAIINTNKETNEGHSFVIYSGGANDAKGDGTLFTFTLTPKAGITYPQTTKVDISYKQADTCNALLEDVVLNCVGGTITFNGVEPPPEPGPVTYTVDSVTKSYVPAGGTVDVDVSVDTKGLDLSMVDVVVGYDTTDWELVGGVAGAVLDQFGTHDVNITPVEPMQDVLGEAWITGMNTKNVAETSGVLATLTFKAKTTLTESARCEITILRKNAESLDAENGQVEHETVGVDGGISIGTVSVEAGSVAFTLGSYTSAEVIPAGTEVALNVTSSAIEQLGMLELKLGYDENKLELKEAALGDALAGFIQKDVVSDPAEPVESEYSGQIWITAMGDNQAISEGAVIAALTFTTKVDINVGESVAVVPVSDPLAAYEEGGTVYAYALTKDNVVGGVISAEAPATEPTTGTEPGATTTTGKPGETTTAAVGGTQPTTAPGSPEGPKTGVEDNTLVVMIVAAVALLAGIGAVVASKKVRSK